MAEIRLSKLTKQFSIGLQRLVEFLNEKGAGVEMNPNAKVSDEFLPALEAKFGEDLKLKKDSEKVTIKLKEIIELGAKKKPSQEEEDAPEREVVIKSNVLNTEVAKSAPAVEEKPVAVEPVKEEKPVMVEKKVVETPSVEPVQQVAEPAQTGPKVIDRIDLSKFEKKAPAKKEEKPVETEQAEEPVSTPTPVETPAPAPVPVVEETPVPVEKPKSEPREMKDRKSVV